MVKFDTLKLWLRVCILILLIIFLVLFNTLPKSHCDMCEFNMENGKNIDSEKFLDLYFDKCINQYGSLNIGNLELLNQSLPA